MCWLRNIVRPKDKTGETHENENPLRSGAFTEQSNIELLIRWRLEGIGGHLLYFSFWQVGIGRQKSSMKNTEQYEREWDDWRVRSRQGEVRWPATVSLSFWPKFPTLHQTGCTRQCCTRKSCTKCCSTRRCTKSFSNIKSFSFRGDVPGWEEGLRNRVEPNFKPMGNK